MLKLAMAVYSPLFFRDVVEVRSIVEFKGPTSWFLDTRDTWGK